MPPKRHSSRGRFSAKREAVLRLLRGESLDEVSRELGVKASTLSQWRDGFLEAGMSGLASKKADLRDEQISNLQRNLRQALLLFKEQYNHNWLVQKHGHLTPHQARLKLTQRATQAA